jgi:hypothetical protein
MRAASMASPIFPPPMKAIFMALKPHELKGSQLSLRAKRSNPIVRITTKIGIASSLALLAMTFLLHHNIHQFPGNVYSIYYLLALKVGLHSR